MHPKPVKGGRHFDFDSFGQPNKYQNMKMCHPAIEGTGSLKNYRFFESTKSI